MPESSWLCCSQCSSLHVLLSPERENTHETHAGELNKIPWFWSASQSNSLKTDPFVPIYHSPSLLISML
ncbi:hypothetical protein NC651_023772 [Populus alba x Populus x berolinensis]|nr:hypothetical protein NC651_023772 [Populus alba x Populus x berolinensis]